MLKSVEGTYRDGKIELAEEVSDPGPLRVIVTFLDGSRVDLPTRGINPGHASDLRARLRTFGEDWDRPDMDGYDAL